MGGTVRRPRADALRNAERLLAEADAVFRDRGTDASLEGIARRAGVAIGTLYAHFPNRRALVGALLRDRNDALFARGDELASLAEPAPALREWIEAVVAHAATYQGLAELLADGADDAASELHASCERLTAISDRLLDTARRTGAVHSDVTGADVFTLMNAAAWTRAHASAAQAARFLARSVDGLLVDEVG